MLFCGMPPVRDGGSGSSVKPGELIQFDVAKAEDVAHGLVALATVLGEGASIFGNQAGYVTQMWSGRFRVSFDTWAASYLAEAPQLAEQLLRMASAILAASEDAGAYNNLVATAPPGSAPAVPDPTRWAALA